MFGLGKEKSSSAEMPAFVMMLRPFMPMVKPHLPSLMNLVAEFLPTYAETIAKEYSLPKVIFLMDFIEENNKKIAIIKFMSVIDGKTEVLKKKDGTAYVERASDLLSKMLENGLNSMNQEEEEED